MSTSPPPRTARVAPLIQAVLGELLGQQVQDPRIGLVTVSEVSLSPDLKNARVYTSIIGDAQHIEQSLRGLKAAAPFLRTKLAKRLNIRTVPHLTFCHDTTLDHAERIEMLLRQCPDTPNQPLAEPAPLPQPQTHRSGRAGLPPPRATVVGRSGRNRRARRRPAGGR